MARNEFLMAATSRGALRKPGSNLGWFEPGDATATRQMY